MKNLNFISLIKVSKDLLLALFLFGVCRLLFYCFNYAYFSDIGLIALIKIFIAGIRFDISALLIINSVYILLALLPLIHKENKGYQFFLKLLFLSFNSLALLLNCIDFSYFKFTLKRTTSDLFFVREDIGNLLGQYIIDYWYIAILWILLSFLLYRFYSCQTVIIRSGLS